MTTDYKYDIFLSFSSKDISIARKIFDDLSSNGLKVFFSDEAMRTKIGSQWKDELQIALQHSKHFILLCSHVSMKAKWVKREGDTFYNCFYSPGEREFVPVLIKGYKESELPFFYQSIQTVQQNSIYQLPEFFKPSLVVPEKSIKPPKDIRVDLKVTKEEAKKGCKKSVNINNTVFIITIPENTPNKKIMRLNGKGDNGGDVLVFIILQKERFVTKPNKRTVLPPNKQANSLKNSIHREEIKKNNNNESYISKFNKRAGLQTRKYISPNKNVNKGKKENISESYISKFNKRAEQQAKLKKKSKPVTNIEENKISLTSLKDIFLSFNTNKKIIFKDRINGAIKLAVVCLITLIILYLISRSSRVTPLLKNIWLYFYLLGWIGIGFITGNRKWRVLITSSIGCIASIFGFHSEYVLDYELLNIAITSFLYMLLTLGIIIMNFED